jgi:hypothetical protein
MNSRNLTVLTVIAGVLALGEFGSALMIWLEHTGPAAGVLLAVLFGLLFLLGAWLLRSGRVTDGTIFVGLLCLVEVAGIPTYARHNAGDWAFQISYGLVSLAGLIAAIALLASRRRSSVTAE